MFASVRRYHNVPDIDRLKDMCEEGLVPIFRRNPGFRAYYGIGSGTDLVTVSLYDSEESARASAKQAAEWIASLDEGLMPPASDTLNGEAKLVVTA